MIDHNPLLLTDLLFQIKGPDLNCDRITQMLMPASIFLCGLAPANPADVLETNLGPGSTATVKLDTLDFVVRSPADLKSWSSVLAHFNPLHFKLGFYESPRPIVRNPGVPSASFLSTSEVDIFSRSWDQLMRFSAIGVGSVLLVKDVPSQMALSDCLLRGSKAEPDRSGMVFELCSISEPDQAVERLEERCLAIILDELRGRQDIDPNRRFSLQCYTCPTPE